MTPGAPVITPFLRQTFPAMSARMAPVWMTMLLVYAVFEQAIRPADVHRALHAQSAFEAAQTWALVSGAWILAAAPHVRAVCFGDRARPFWRLGVTPASWSSWLAPALWWSAAPLLVLAAWYLDLPALARAAVVLGWAPIGLLGMAHASLVGVACALVAVAGIAGLMGLGHAHGFAWPEVWWGAAVVSLVAGRRWTGAVYRALHGRPLWRLTLPGWVWARGPVSAVVWRDAQCLARTERWHLMGWGAAVAVTAGFSFAVARHENPGEYAVWSLVAAFSPLSSVLTSRLRGRLGRAWHPDRWPISPAGRVLAAWIVAAAPLVTTALVATLAALATAATTRPATTGSTPALELLRAGLFAAALAAGWLWSVLATSRHRNAPGYMMFGVLLLLVAVFRPLTLALPLLAVALAALLAGATRALTQRRERAFHTTPPAPPSEET